MASRKTTKKSKQTSLPAINPDTQNMMIGIFLIAISLLFFFTTQDPTNGEMPVIGQFLRGIGLYLFGPYFQWIFSPVLLALGIMILMRKTEWNSLKFFGIFGFFISITSLIGWFQSDLTGNIFFNLYLPLKNMIGSEMTFILLLSIFLVSLYLIFQVSYSRILRHVSNHTKNVITQMRVPEEDFSETIVNFHKKKPAFNNKKAAKINEELESIRQEKEVKNREQEGYTPPGKKIIQGFLSKNSQNHEENYYENSENTSSGKILKKPAFLNPDKKIPLQDSS